MGRRALVEDYIMKRFTYIVLLTLLAVAVYAGWFFFSKSDESLKNQQAIVSESVSEGGPASPLASQGGPEIHPVSLPALMMKNFDGRELELGRILEQNSAYTRYYITYKSLPAGEAGGELTISGIMNKPAGEGPFPLLVLNHGYIDPQVYTNGRGLRREQDYFARRGYVVLHPDYRNHADSDSDPETDVRFRLGYAEDVINAVLAAKNSGFDFIDGQRVGLLGHSMGGGVTLNVLVVRPELVSAAMLYAPVNADYRLNYERWTKSRPETAAEIARRFGTPKESPEFWDNISAKNFFEKISAPILINHGTEDESVPYEWSVALEQDLKVAGKDVTFYTYEGEKHEFIPDWSLMMQRTLEFFDSKLK